MIARKRIPAPAPRWHASETLSGADDQRIQPPELRRGPLSRRDWPVQSDLQPDAVKGKSYRLRHD